MVLARNHVGRLAFSFHDRVDIRPVGYAYEPGWIYGRTSAGDKLLAVRHNPWVAFEVDEVDGPFRWRSVVARGRLTLLDADGSPLEQEARERGLALLRAADARSFTQADPAPLRTIVFRIAIDELGGRSGDLR